MSKLFKTVLSVVISVICIFSFTAVCFADGPEVFGEEYSAIYHIQSNTIFAADPVPVVEDSAGNYVRVTDVMGGAFGVYSEGVSLQAYYASLCTNCGKANGGSSVSEFLSEDSVCAHCGERTPYEDGVKVYRFIVVPNGSAHYSAFHNYDFTNIRKSVFKDTEQLYGNGRDLPQKNLIFEEVTQDDGSVQTVLSGFETGFVVARSNGTLFNAITGMQIMLEKMGNSKLNEIIFRFNLFLAEHWESFLVSLVTF